jgi:mono/diheme cytochrome c family protein
MSTVTAQPEVAAPAGERCCALLAEFDAPATLLAAAARVRDAGYRHWDTHTPFPVHGIDQAMGIRPTRLPWLVFAAGVAGCLAGLGLQWWTNATSPGHFSWLPTNLQGYDFVISGKPLFSLPANIPVIFEVTVLFAALATVGGMFVLNNLPQHATPLLAHPRFRRATTDRFYLAIAATDPQFEAQRTAALLRELGSRAVEPVPDIPGSARLPRAFTIGAMLLVCLALLPPLLVAQARASKSTSPRIHIIQDMDKQPRFKAQRPNPLFADGRAQRPEIPNTVAWQAARNDPLFYEGRAADGWATRFPPQLELNEGFVRRGQERFTIYCAPCHGYDGAGGGIVGQRALELGTPGWNPPTSLVAPDSIVRNQPHGQVFNTITRGVRTMPPYGDQIPERDRWAIIAYVRALQRSQDARIEDVPADVRPELR